MTFTCPHCKKKFALADIAKHFKANKISIAKLNILYPKADLFTKQPLEHKTLDSYFLCDFATKITQRKWLVNQSPEVARDAIVSWFKKYCGVKGIKNMPMLVELYSIKCLPNPKTILSYFDDLNEVANLAGLNSLFMYGEPIVSYNTPPLKISIDTREKKPIKIDKKYHKIKSEKVECGDYSIGGKVNVERKSGGDFTGTLCAGYERFIKEVERAKSRGEKLVILVEQPVTYFYSLIAKRWTKTNPDFIFFRMRELLRNYYGTIQFVFCRDREHLTLITPYILWKGKDIFKYDIQSLLISE